jgi:hypothetical protein
LAAYVKRYHLFFVGRAGCERLNPELSIRILSAKTAAVQYDLLAFDIIAKSEATESQPVLAFLWRAVRGFQQG